MLKLLEAEFKNFRLLRNLSLNFSGENAKTLTVIRAENETGKTTIMNALQWALYGDDALPDKGQGYRLHPIDWEGESVPISVRVDFEHTSLQRNRNGNVEVKRRYRIVRSARESIQDATKKWKRDSSTVELFRLEDTGVKPVEHTAAKIMNMFIPELREVFFTDGDSALSFIEASSTTVKRRERVEKAIRSLLGLEVIEDALKHMNKIKSDVNKAIAKGSDDNEGLSTIANNIEKNKEDIDELDKKIKDAEIQIANFTDKITDIESKIEAALIKGDREQLKKDLEQSQKQLKRIREQKTDAAEQHSQLFRGMALARALLAPAFEKSLAKLTELHDKGKIPSTTIPILEERLEKGVCICGELLSSDDANGKNRCAHIRELIEKSQGADARQAILTELYYASRSLQFIQTDNAGWQVDYDNISNQRDDLRIEEGEEGEKSKALEATLDKIPDTDIKGLRDTKRDYEFQKDRRNTQMIENKQQVKLLSKEQKELEAKFEVLLSKQKKNKGILAEHNVIQDITNVLENSYERITNDELNKVSQLMNRIFLEMIGVDSEQEAIISRAEISKEFDIVVYSKKDRTLNPDRDLNGASRRALTLAFILALTKVSEVEAPNVIDTPLGMMSGHVKKSVLKIAIRESAQLILFLTRSEIADCEEILDAEATCVMTLTNSTHYPSMLVNDPQTKESMILQCECDHRNTCELCKRRIDIEAESPKGERHDATLS